MTDGHETRDLKNRKDPLPVGVFAVFTPDEAMPRDRGLYLKRRLGVAVIGLFVTCGVWLLGASPDLLEDFYANGVSATQVWGLSQVTSMVPTSLAEVAIVLILGYGLLVFAIALANVIRRKRRAMNAIACGALKLVAFVGFAVGAFYLIWGGNYLRQPIDQRLGWDAAPAFDDADDQADHLAEVAEELIERTNAAYVAAHGQDDIGVPSAIPTDMEVLDHDLDDGYRVADERWGLGETFRRDYGPAKPVATSVLMSAFSNGGFFFPWTGEANYNRLQPQVAIPHVIAHEKAHQRGIAGEDECNFLGTLACVYSDNAYAQYSGWLFAQRSVLRALAKLDMERARDLVAMRHAGVQRDVNDFIEFWTGKQSQVSKAARKTNDTYLKLNQQKSGIESYREDVRLLLVWAQATENRFTDKVEE